MKKKRTVIYLVLSPIIVFIILTIIHILQSAPLGWDKKSLEEIVGLPAESIIYNDVKDLSKSQITQIFYASDVPNLEDMSQEYYGKLAPVGAIYFTGQFFTYFIYGEMDSWIGKGFNPYIENNNTGYNLFKSKDDPTKIIKKRKIAIYIKKSQLDNKNCLILDYSPFNTGVVNNFRDEVRKINDELYVGIGYLTCPTGSIINYPFFLYSKN